jgi:hypothetical protein
MRNKTDRWYLENLRHGETDRCFEISSDFKSVLPYARLLLSALHALPKHFRAAKALHHRIASTLEHQVFNLFVLFTSVYNAATAVR